MLDTVNLWLPQSQIPASVYTHLDRPKEHIDARSGEISFSGYADNYQVSVFSHGISLKGSLAKFYLQDNFQTLTRKGTEEAIESLSDKLRLKVNEAEVKRVDIAQNFIMKYQHQAYYDLLGTCQHFKRLEQPKSIYYNNTNKQLIFYNKIAEGKHRRLEIPSVWDNKQVLRYEFRYLRKPDIHLGVSELKAQNLYDEEVYMKLINGWLQHYHQVNKIRLQSFAKEVMNDNKLFKKQLMLLGLQMLGGDQEVLSMIERAKAEGKFDNRMQASRLKQDIENISKDLVLTEQSELIAELDSKVKQSAQYYR